jgi:hypothetical protein
MDLLRAACLSLLILALVPAARAQSLEPGQSFRGRVLHTDGEHFAIRRVDGDTLRVTLWGVALDPSPEYEALTRQRVREEVVGRQVRVIVEDTARTVGPLVRIEVGREDLGRRLVREGLAWWDRREARNASELEQLEHEARAAGRGLWAQAAPEPPWRSTFEMDPVPPAISGLSQPPSLVDLALDNLSEANLAFTAPSEIGLGEVRLIELAVSPSASAKDLLDTLEGRTEADTVQARVSSIMTATLKGPAFEIEAITPETQAISFSEPTRWEWYATPIHPGLQQLRLALSARIEVEGTPTTRSIETFRRDITVHVPWSQRIASFFAAHWQWLLTVLLLPLVRWGWTRWYATEDVETSAAG